MSRSLMMMISSWWIAIDHQVLSSNLRFPLHVLYFYLYFYVFLFLHKINFMMLHCKADYTVFGITLHYRCEMSMPLALKFLL